MAKVAIIGAGFAGHTAALYLGDALGKDHEITMVNKFTYFYYIPSWVWVGVGRMPLEKTRFPLKPVYDRLNINFVHGKAIEIYPDEHGRDMFVTHMKMGLAGAWMKRTVHTTFMHKLQGRVGWKMIPE